MVKGGDAARKKATDCMALAAEASSDERRDMLRAMARSWATLADQLDRFETTSVSLRSDTRSELRRAKRSNGSSLGS